MSSQGFVAHYAGLANSGSLDAKLKAAKSFWRFSNDSSKLEKLARDGALDSLLKLIEDHLDDTEGQSIESLFERQDNGSRKISAKHARTTESRKSSLDSRLTMKYSNGTRASRSNDTSMSRSFQEDSRSVLLYAISALCNLSKSKQVVREMVIERECFPILVKLMSHQSLAVQQKAVECVGLLASHKLSSVRFIRQGALLALLGMIRPVHSSDTAARSPSSLSRSSSSNFRHSIASSKLPSRPASSIGAQRLRKDGHKKSLSGVSSFLLVKRDRPTDTSPKQQMSGSTGIKRRVTETDVLLEVFTALRRIDLTCTPPVPLWWTALQSLGVIE